MKRIKYHLPVLYLVLLTFLLGLAQPWARAETIYYTGFENFTPTNLQGWSADNGVWQVGTPTAGPGSAYDGMQCAVTTLAGTYPAYQSSRLISPPINLPSVASGQQITLTFWQWFSWNSGSSGDVQVSTWTGTAWSAWTTVSNSYTGSSGGIWDLASITLTAYAGKQIQIGFQFSSENYTAPGWYIDDVSVDLEAIPYLPLNQTIGFENFTASNWQGWSADNGVWQVGTPAVTAGPGSAFDGKQCAATVLAGTYPAYQSSRLISPPINLPSVASGQQITLTFWQWFSWNSGSSGDVQVSTWTGTAWSAWTTVSNSYTGSSGGIWDLASITLTAYAGKQIQIGFQFSSENYTAPGWYIDDVSVNVALWQMADVAVGSDNKTRLLWNKSDGTAGVWTVDNSGVTSNLINYGPYVGWTASSIAAGADGYTRLLWNKTDGTVALWLLNANNTESSGFNLAPSTGWTAVDIAVGSDNLTRLLRTKSDGTASIWTVDNNGVTSNLTSYGPYPGWTVSRIAAGADGYTRLLWNKTDGTVALWILNANNTEKSGVNFGPSTGWTAVDIAVGADNLTRLLWTSVEGEVGVWSVGNSGNGKNYINWGPYSGWIATRIAAGGDGLSRLLWSNADYTQALWLLNSNNSMSNGFNYGPY